MYRVVAHLSDASKTAKSYRSAFDTAKLKQLESSRMFAKDLDDRLTAHGPLSGPPPQPWEQFKTVTALAKLTIGPKKKVHQHWFDKNKERIRLPGRQEECLHRVAE